MIRKVIPAITLLLALPCLAATSTPAKKHSTTVASHASHSTSRATASKSWVSSRGRKTTKSSATKQTVAAHHQPAAMDSERATKIQEALIRSGYMSGEPSGVWDAQSNAAMQKMQGDNGWQTKITPDSRALIKLGLGGQNGTTPTDQISADGPR